MKRLIFFCGLAGLMLGTAVPPRRASPPREQEAAAAPAEAPPLPDAAAALAPLKPLPTELVNRLPEALPLPAPAPAAAPAPAPAPTPAQVRERAAPEQGPVKIVVSLRQQKAFVYKAGALVAVSPVSTGRRGHETPTGTFPIMEKQVHHRSNRYSNAPMPYMQRLTAYGIALHAGHLPGYPASHGCIRLPWGFARKLYGMTGYGTTVTVTRARVKREA